MSDLEGLLNRATDRIEGPQLADRALAGARRRRTTKRSMAAAAGAAALVAAVALAGSVVGGDGDPSPAPAPTHPGTPTSNGLAVRGPWDPRLVDDLPWRGSEPWVVNPPASAPALGEEPWGPAVMAIPDRSDDRSAMLLGEDGTWRTVELPVTRLPTVYLSDDGTRLAVQASDGVDVDVWNLPAGTRTQTTAPEGCEDIDAVGWAWIDDDTLLCTEGTGGRLVDVSSGAAPPVDYPDDAMDWDVDAEGGVVQSAMLGRPNVITDWADERPRVTDAAEIGRLSTLEVDGQSIAGTTYPSYPTVPTRVVLVDRADLTTLASLRIHDQSAMFRAGGRLQVVGLRDGRVLMQVVPDLSAHRWRLVSWDSGSGSLSLVASGDQDVPIPLALAEDLLD